MAINLIKSNSKFLIEILYKKANEYLKIGEVNQALSKLEDTLKLNSDFFPSLNLIAKIYANVNNFKAALPYFKKAAFLKKDKFTLNNLANCYSELNEHKASFDIFEEAILADNKFDGTYANYATALLKSNENKKALNLFFFAIALNPQNTKSYLGVGNSFLKLNRQNLALKYFNLSLSIDNQNYEAYDGLGILYFKENYLKDALSFFDKTIELKRDHAEAYYNRGVVLTELKQFDEAVASFERAIDIKTDYEYLHGTLLHTKNIMCNWLNYDFNVQKLILGIKSGAKVSEGLVVLALIDSLKVQLKATQIYINDHYPFTSLPDIPIKYHLKNKICIGYFSADFREHPVSYLTAELFELHDKCSFELIAFYYGPIDSSDMNKRISSAFDRFIDVRNQSDHEIALMSRNLNIDIAVDLTGFTKLGRIGIFAYRAAPIQLSYLGYLGSMGVEYYDYLIADKTIIPVESQQYYKEKIIYLPSFQVNDSKREIKNKIFSRVELNLPENNFYFCCFSNSYKITPVIFESWMKILTAVPASVLILFAPNKWVQENLKLEAEKKGVLQNRLVFCDHIERSEYLARFKVFDLFLDTFPYNSGTTASDALWAGLPILTLIGESFASRVAASLLNAIDLPELITTTLEEYEATAIKLATSLVSFRKIKEKLERNRLTTALFDTKSFTNNIESAYKKIYDRYQSNLPPEHIYIAP
jgi:protein O-GlcNAc transferase